MRWPYLHGICLRQVDAQVGLLIGNGNARALEPLKSSKVEVKDPMQLGLCLYVWVDGPLGCESDGASRRGDIELAKQFKKFYELEFSDSIVDATAQMSREDLKAVEIIEQTAVLNYYQMELAWKSQHPLLPTKRALVEHRLKPLKKRLSRDPDLFRKYLSFIDDCLHKGYCEKVQTAH